MGSTYFIPVLDICFWHQSLHLSYTGSIQSHFHKCYSHVTLVGITGTTVLGWGLLSQFSPLRYFRNFSALEKHALAVGYHFYILQVSPELVKYICDSNNLRGNFAWSRILRTEKLMNPGLVTTTPGALSEGSLCYTDLKTGAIVNWIEPAIQ